MRILTIGDVCSPLGVEALALKLRGLKKRFSADLCIVNGENSALGNGITPQSAQGIFSAGADVITGGNHSFRRKEIYDFLDENPFILRPHNLEGEWGTGYCFLDLGADSLCVINLSGQIYLDNRLSASNPFNAADELIERAKSEGAKNIILDFHAEATSEKRALGFYLDGRISAMFGTHTHVQTADAQILPCGTGYITDLGMSGPIDSVLGMEKSIIINRLKDGDQTKFQFATGKAVISGCLFEIENGLCTQVVPFTEHH